MCDVVLQWSAERSTVPIAGNPDLAGALVGIGVPLRQAITNAMTAVQTENASAVEQYRWSVEHLDAETDPALLIRDADSVFAMASHCRTATPWIRRSPRNSRPGSPHRRPTPSSPPRRTTLLPSAKEFLEHANLRMQAFPFHSLMSWDEPPIAAGRHARAAGRP